MGWPSAAAGDGAGAGTPPPPPPPRRRSSSPPPPYEPWESPGAAGPAMLDPQPWTQPHTALHAGDPRSSSTQSLVPSLHADEARRILLLVYIHGFMGNNTSFRSFPAHVHSYLKEALADSHVIHSKVYPRYKTYKAIEVARDNFSNWLEPHESDQTDTILIGHSMGGLLAADVALMPSPNRVYGHPFKHRILGTISLDAPLLGLHPGIIKSGLASLFRKAPDPPGKGQELADSLAAQNASGSLSFDDGQSFSTDGAFSSGMTSPAPLASISSNASGPSRPDPTFDPPFFNDVQFVDRGWWRNVAHFAKKHYSEGIFTSAYQHLLSHLEFGACLADYGALKNRYSKIRQLEDVDELHSGVASGKGEVRVRYVNYYTVSTGIPKEPPPQPSVPKRSNTHLRPEPLESTQSVTATSSQASTPRISVEDYSDGERIQSMQLLDPVPEPDSEPEVSVEPPLPNNDSNSKGKTPGSSTADRTEGGENGEAGVGAAAGPEAGEGGEADAAADPNNDLPAIPPAPEPPQAPDLERYTDKDAKKQAEKEFRRLQKTYDQAVKNREKAVREREKLVEKRRKKALKEVEKRQKEEEKRQKEEEKRLAKEQKEKKPASKKSQPGEEEEDDVDVDAEQGNSSSSASRAQVVTPAQAQALERQLTDLAFHDQTPASPPALSPETSSQPLTATNSNNNDATNSTRGKAKEKPPKLRKFCMLPQKVGGVHDPVWVQVYMEGVDEVGAHCGLFFLGPHYEKLVGDVGGRIVGWLQEDMSKNAILALD